MFKFNLITTEKYEFPEEWDVIIIGAGPAGLTAALYSARYGLKTLVISPDIGGMLLEAELIENYPGFERIRGTELAKLFAEQVRKAGASILNEKVTKAEILDENWFKVETSGGYVFRSRAIIIATGASRRKLNVKGENLPGVSYCAECDAHFFKDKVVGVVGGGNTAFHDALVLSNVARKVYLIHRRDQFRAEKALVEAAKRNPKIEILTNKRVIEICGENKVECVKLEDTKTGAKETLELDGLFVAIGMVPNVEIAKQLGVELDERGKIKVDNCQRTNVPRVYAAGNITNACCDFDQIITSAAQGAVAAKSAYEDLIEKVKK